MAKKKRFFHPFYFVFLCGLGIVGGVWWSGKNINIDSIDRYAQAVIKKCAMVAYRPSCYDQEIPKLMEKISMEDAFAVTKKVQDRDSQFAYCHVVAHKLSYKESAKNPTKWKEVLPRCPVSACNYGCLHGSLMQRFQNDVLTDAQIQEALPELETVCEPRQGFTPTEIDRSMCYHAMGHLTLFITGANIPKALEVCADISVKRDGRDYLRTCYEGIFMTVFQGIEPEDLALVKAIKPTRETISAFCSHYTGIVRASCYRESYPLFASDIQTPAGAVEFCNYAKEQEEIDNCYNVVLNTLTTTWFSQGENLSAVSPYCAGLPSAIHAICFASAATRLVQMDPLRNIDTAIAICEGAKAYGVADICYRDVVSYASFSFDTGSEQFQRYCNELPSDWKESCLSGKNI